MQGSEFKLCPYCKEEIRTSAIKCRYCGEWLEEQRQSRLPQPAEERVEVKPSDLATSSSPLPLPPEAKLTDDTEAASGSPSPPAVEEQQPVTDTSTNPATQKRSNYFVRHWRGELSLGVSYWANGILANFLLALVVGVGASLHETASLKSVAALFIFFYAFSLALSFWQIVGTWLSARYHVRRGGLMIWANLAQISLLLAAWKVANVAATNIFPQTAEFWNILCGDKGIPAYSIHVLLGGTELEFSGGIRAGSAKELERALQANPKIKVLRMNSGGGRVGEATRMARLVRERGLNTYTSEYCLSAATLVFIAGKERVVAEGAKLGFHLATFPGMTVEQLRVSDEVVRQAMVAAGVARDFVQRAQATPSGDMWYPSVQELRVAGVITKEDAPLRTIASNMVNFLDNTTSSDGFKPESTGHEDIDQLMKTFTEFGRRWGGVVGAMNTELERMGEPDIYSDLILQDTEKIRDVLNIYSKRKQVIERYHSKTQEEVRWLTNEFAAMKYSEATAKGMLKEMNRSVEIGRAQATQLLRLRSDAETAKERFLGFMLETFSNYKLAGSKISFSKTADAERYRALGKAITDSSNALDELQTEMSKSTDASRAQLKKLAQ